MNIDLDTATVMLLNEVTKFIDKCYEELSGMEMGDSYIIVDGKRCGGERMLNKVILQGRLVADPETRHTTNGTEVTSFRLAVDRDFKNQNRDREADFINVVAWRNTAEFVSGYFQKGQMAIIVGRLQVRSYTDRDGNNRYITEVVADSVYFAGSKPTTNETGGFEPLDDDDGELPFM